MSVQIVVKEQQKSTEIQLGSLWQDKDAAIYILLRIVTFGYVTIRIDSAGCFDEYWFAESAKEDAVIGLTPFYGSVTIANIQD